MKLKQRDVLDKQTFEAGYQVPRHPSDPLTLFQQKALMDPPSDPAVASEVMRIAFDKKWIGKFSMTKIVQLRTLHTIAVEVLPFLCRRSPFLCLATTYTPFFVLSSGLRICLFFSKWILVAGRAGGCGAGPTGTPCSEKNNPERRGWFGDNDNDRGKGSSKECQ